MKTFLRWVGILLGLVVLAIAIHSCTMSPEKSRAYDRLRAVERKCDQIMGDSAPGGERRTARMLCEQMIDEARRNVDNTP